MNETTNSQQAIKARLTISPPCFRMPEIYRSAATCQ
jgi:hypothetical protein